MKKSKIIGITLLSIFSLCAISAVARISSKGEIVKTIEVANAEEDYYASISDDLTGDALKTALNTLNKSKRKKTVGYAGMKTFAAICDADPDGSGKIIGFYDNVKVGPSWDSAKTWNREHVWPNVRGGDKVEGDAHMTRPASTKTNGDRGSKGYSTKAYDPGQFVAYYRGAASRIIFYAAIADTSLQLVDFPFNYNGIQNGNSGYPTDSMGSLSEMLKWNLQYQPQDTSFTGDDDLARRTELNRNEKIEKASGGQGNRNPFIDHPEYACKIWGNYNDETRKVCGNVDYDTSLEISGSLTKKEYQVGETFDPSGLTVTYTVNDAATVVTNDVTWNLGKFTKAGKFSVTATYHEIMATHTEKVTVVSASGGGGDNSDSSSETPNSSDSSDSSHEYMGGGGCHASVEGSSSIIFISSGVLLFFAIRQAIRMKKKKE